MNNEQIQILRTLNRKAARMGSLVGEQDKNDFRKMLHGLEESGYIKQYDAWTWAIDDAGRDYLKSLVTLTPSRVFCNYSQKDTYSVPTWPNNRAGSNAHQSVGSRGVSC